MKLLEVESTKAISEFQELQMVVPFYDRKDENFIEFSKGEGNLAKLEGSFSIRGDHIPIYMLQQQPYSYQRKSHKYPPSIFS
jgi:hypothetical protein